MARPHKKPSRRLAARIGRASRVLAAEGPRGLLGRVASRAAMQYQAGSSMLVDPRDAQAVDWSVKPEAHQNRIAVNEGPLVLGWLTSPPGAESGGHQNMFRFIRYAEQAGHTCRIYLYDARHLGVRLEDVRAMLALDAYPQLDATIEWYDRSQGVSEDVQALFATGWETAYPAFLDRSTARRFYFVQDFEPAFYPLGTEYVLAENTYRFGFHGITAGHWLERKLADDYGMTADHYDFGADRNRYCVEREGPRDGVFFYARPSTPRRAFELGAMALAEFAALRPEAVIHTAGERFARHQAPFSHVVHGSLALSELNTLYNGCAAGLVLSLTNMSLLPLELLAAGVTPVVNDAPSNRQVIDIPAISWVNPSPVAIARGLVAAFDAGREGARARANAAAVQGHDWNRSGAQFLAALNRAMQGLSEH